MKTGSNTKNSVLAITWCQLTGDSKWKSNRWKPGVILKILSLLYLMSADRREQVNIKQMTSRDHSHIFRWLTSTTSLTSLALEYHKLSWCPVFTYTIYVRMLQHFSVFHIWLAERLSLYYLTGRHFTNFAIVYHAFAITGDHHFEDLFEMIFLPDRRLLLPLATGVVASQNKFMFTGCIWASSRHFLLSPPWPAGGGKEWSFYAWNLIRTFLNSFTIIERRTPIFHIFNWTQFTQVCLSWSVHALFNFTYSHTHLI
jgi:hypothetical protein